GRLWEAARLASLFKKSPSIGGAALGGGASRVAFPEPRANSRRMRCRAVSPNIKAAKVTAFPYCRTPQRGG
ncbi:MAG: hypothetical protein J6J31_08240, partial [Thermoguttaceae bacterium]|nr:hypothetical protein [Thermoguttaceae bacterium]